jgi:hypothetical protein
MPVLPTPAAHRAPASAVSVLSCVFLRLRAAAVAHLPPYPPPSRRRPPQAVPRTQEAYRLAAAACAAAAGARRTTHTQTARPRAAPAAPPALAGKAAFGPHSACARRLSLVAAVMLGLSVRRLASRRLRERRRRRLWRATIPVADADTVEGPSSAGADGGL